MYTLLFKIHVIYSLKVFCWAGRVLTLGCVVIILYQQSLSSIRKEIITQLSTFRAARNIFTVTGKLLCEIRIITEALIKAQEHLSSRHRLCI